MTKHQKRLLAGSVALLTFIIALLHHTLFFPFILIASFFLYSEYFNMFSKYVSGKIPLILCFGFHSILLLLMYVFLLLPAEDTSRFILNIRPPENILLWIPVFIYSGFILLSFYHVLKYDKNTFTTSLVTSLFALFYLSIPILCTLYLFMQETRTVFFIPFLIVWLNDSAAYYMGSHWGKRKIAPSISPNKTFMGTFGSIVATTIIFLIIKVIWSGFPMTFIHIILFIPPLCCIAHLGDFTESGIKRTLDVKDSGNIMPGHGGILDRVDSLLFVMTLFVIFTPLLT